MLFMGSKLLELNGQILQTPRGACDIYFLLNYSGTKYNNLVASICLVIT